MTADELAAAPHYVYRLRDAQGGLLYIGCSVNPEARLAAHRNDQDWTDLIDHQEIEGPYERSDALAREAAAITAEGPRFNIAHNLNPERVERPSDGAFLYVKRHVCLSGRGIGRAFYRGQLPLRPTREDVRAWVATLDTRYHLCPCPFEPDCSCSQDPADEYAAWADNAMASA